MPINIRKAKLSDLLKTYEWANEKEVIKSSIERYGKVTLAEHKKWFKNYLESKSKNLFIARLNNKKIGLVRLDLKKKEYFISYLVDKKNRNKGFGFKILNKIIKKYKNKKIIFKARVKKENFASNIIFARLGFRKRYINHNKNISLYRLDNSKC